MRILTELKNALLLLETEGAEFTPEAVTELARFATQVNDATENIGARRLATVLETVLEDVSFEAGGGSPRKVQIDGEEVRRRLTPLVKDQDLARFIL